MTNPNITCPARGKHDKEGRQQALVDAATSVFAEHGYDAATTREVAERAGCSEGLIHRYFGGKRGLLLAILDSKAQTLVEEFHETLGEPRSLGDDLAKILEWQLDSMWARREFMRVCISQAVIDAEVGRLIGERLNEQRVRLIAARLDQHLQAGRIAADVDINALAHALTGIGFSLGCMAQSVFQTDRKRVREIADSAAAVLSRGAAKLPVRTER